jgi:hypothetical protein
MELNTNDTSISPLKRRVSPNPSQPRIIGDRTTIGIVRTSEIQKRLRKSAAIAA